MDVIRHIRRLHVLFLEDLRLRLQVDRGLNRVQEVNRGLGHVDRQCRRRRCHSKSHHNGSSDNIH